MKKTALFFALFISMLSFSQIHFEKAYFVTNSDQKTECLIKNIGWKSNPTSFEYKTGEDAKIQTADIRNVKEFEIYNQVKYVRSTVKIDRSSQDINKLSKVRKPEFIEEQLFLKELTSGNANLYKYSDGNLIRYFFQMGGNEIQQLIYKPYQAEKESVIYKSYNTDYKKQLEQNLVCPNISSNEIQKIEYKEKPLTELFIKYNECSDPNYKNTSIKNSNKGKINLSIRPRINSSSVSLSNSNRINLDLSNKLAFSAGLEAEYVFPFNKNKWSIIIEPSYQYYKSENTSDVNYLVGNKLIADVDYKSIEIPIGIRHYMYLNDQSKLFVNAQYVLDFVMNSSIEFKRSDNSIYETLTVDSKPNFAIGVGYNYNNKYAVEARYYTKRNITNGYLAWNNNYQNISLIFGYNIF